ncbi:MAG TPA: hypothetical protein VK308_00170 [Pyrinomonadaceae bacterium]|nr:hypothetical protein [Pyrinomonadaceae bacterium]
MKTTNSSVLRELFEKSQAVLVKKQKVRAVEQVALLARQSDDFNLAAQIYHELFKTGNAIEDIRSALLGLGSMRGLYDQLPESVNLKELFACYVKTLVFFPGYLRLTRGQILGLLSEAENLSRKIGNSAKVSLYLKSAAMWGLGEIPSARQLTRRWYEQPYVKGDFPCLPCMKRNIISLQIFYDWEHLEEPFREAKAFNRLNPVCEDYYYEVKAEYAFSLPLLKRERAEESREHREVEIFYEQKKEAVFSGRENISDAAALLRILALTKLRKKSADEAVRIIENYAKKALKTQNSYRVFSFYQTAWLYFHKRYKNTTKELKMHLPKEFSVNNEKGVYKCKALENWFRQEALQQAERIDKRNQNNYFTKHMLGKGSK